MTENADGFAIETLEAGIVQVTLTRPDTLNALRSADVEALARWFRSVADDRSVRTVILTGEGRAFSSGMDMRSGLGDDAPSAEDSRIAPGRWILGRLTDVIQAVRAAPQLVIAAVNGPAVGFGLALALAADVRFISTSGFFLNGFLSVGGQGAEAGVSYLLPRLASAPLAATLLYTQRRVPALEAATGGLTHAPVAPEELMLEALSFARDVVAASSFDGIALTKSAVVAGGQMSSFSAALELETRGQMILG